jgi:2-C-methyl-D-erythritol 4-phosphate cytidylyltransferase
MVSARGERVVALIVAGGDPSGRTEAATGGFDRIFANLGGQPVLAHTISTFEACTAVDEIIVVVSKANLQRAWRLAASQGWRKVTKIVPGGARRQDSVSHGLQAMGECGWVIIHDGARPFVTCHLIENCLATAYEVGAAIVAVPSREAVKMVNHAAMVRATPNRSDIWYVQTPQVFRTDLIVAAYRNAFGEVSDDSVLLERSGQPVKVCMGTYDNMKINDADDLILAQAILQKRARR